MSVAGAGRSGGGAVRLFPLHDLLTRFQGVFIQVGGSLEPADIARLAMTCTAGRALSEPLYKQVCDTFGYKQTGSRFRPVPYAQIFTRHLCVECWQPAAMDHASRLIDLNGGSGRGHQANAGLMAPAHPGVQGVSVKWLCGKCRRAIPGKTPSEKLKKGLPNTARRYGDAVRRRIVYSVA
mmetsp:Transcript_48938/g.115564  ORF Transcript_48938/g.115564 Transcript_48938/m.115564 type:complete len:180 (-) Transcript_48938:41-580(-)